MSEQSMSIQHPRNRLVAQSTDRIFHRRSVGTYIVDKLIAYV